MISLVPCSKTPLEILPLGADRLTALSLLGVTSTNPIPVVTP